MYWGIDGCKNGWIAIGLGDTDEQQAAVYPTLSAFWEANHETAQLVLVDMPMGIPDNVERRVEAAARATIQSRYSSFFPVPARQTLTFAAEKHFAAEAYQVASDLNQSLLGKRLSKQTWNIMPKIHEVDRFLIDTDAAQAHIVEGHPEVLFWALNGCKPLRYPKSQGLGFHERLGILQRFLPDALTLIQTVYDAHSRYLNDDDVVDALVCAVSARLGNLRSIPEVPDVDRAGLPMQIVYPQLP